MLSAITNIYTWDFIFILRGFVFSPPDTPTVRVCVWSGELFVHMMDLLSSGFLGEASKEQ